MKLLLPFLFLFSAPLSALEQSPVNVKMLKASNTVFWCTCRMNIEENKKKNYKFRVYQYTRGDDNPIVIKEDIFKDKKSCETHQEEQLICKSY